MIDSKRQIDITFSSVDSYVIFIYKGDKFRQGLPIYHIDRYVSETDELFGDGSHIMYVNGNYKGNDEIGQLIRDFHQKMQMTSFIKNWLME